MIRQFCTIIDNQNLSKGIANFRSLLNVCKDVEMFMLTTEEESYQALRKLNINGIIPISLEELFCDNYISSISDSEQTEIYIPYLVLHIFENYECKNCTYITPQLWFYNDPSTMFAQNICDYNVAIIADYNLSKRNDSKSKKYFLQYIYFDGSKNSIKALEFWIKSNLYWLRYHLENKISIKNFDKYYWLPKFDFIRKIVLKGANLSHQNVELFEFEINKGIIEGFSIEKADKILPIYFDFEKLKLFENNKFIFAPKRFILSDQIIQIFYHPYIQQLSIINQEIEKLEILELNSVLSEKDYNSETNSGTLFLTNLWNKYLHHKIT